MAKGTHIVAAALALGFPLFMMSALTSIDYGFSISGVDCGLFTCCNPSGSTVASVGGGKCKQLVAITKDLGDYTKMNKSYMQATAAFALIGFFLGLPAAVMQLVSAGKGFSNRGMAMGGAGLGGATAFSSWLALFILGGTPSGSLLVVKMGPFQLWCACVSITLSTVVTAFEGMSAPRGGEEGDEAKAAASGAGAGGGGAAGTTATANPAYAQSAAVQNAGGVRQAAPGTPQQHMAPAQAAPYSPYFSPQPGSPYAQQPGASAPPATSS